MCTEHVLTRFMRFMHSPAVGTVGLDSRFVGLQALQNVCFQLCVVGDCALQLADLLPRALAGLLRAQHQRSSHGSTSGIQRLLSAVRLHVLPSCNLHLPALQQGEHARTHNNKRNWQ